MAIEDRRTVKARAGGKARAKMWATAKTRQKATETETEMAIVKLAAKANEDSQCRGFCCKWDTKN